jgi:HrpA-like RNA helicase
MTTTTRRPRPRDRPHRDARPDRAIVDAIAELEKNRRRRLVFFRANAKFVTPEALGASNRSAAAHARLPTAEQQKVFQPTPDVASCSPPTSPRRR